MHKPKLFTLIIDYQGGTYICQSTAEDRYSAPSECIKKWDIQDLAKEINEKDKETISLRFGYSSEKFFRRMYANIRI